MKYLRPALGPASFFLTLPITAPILFRFLRAVRRESFESTHCYNFSGFGHLRGVWVESRAAIGEVKVIGERGGVDDSGARGGGFAQAEFGDQCCGVGSAGDDQWTGHHHGAASAAAAGGLWASIPSPFCSIGIVQAAGDGGGG